METNLDDFLEPPQNFLFPFQPYSIQQNFMRNLYSALEKRQLAIFESPTGTGKSLSLICGALTWLRDHELKTEHQIEKAIVKVNQEIQSIEKDAGDDWISSQAKQAELQDVKYKLQTQLDLINERRKDISALRERIVRKLTVTKESVKKLSVVSDEDEEDDFVLEEVSVERDVQTNISDDEADEQSESKEEHKMTKIYFCSRTHSQLSQFINEVRRSPFAEDTCLVPLASRQNYCVNPAVKKLKNLSLINERCSDLLNNKKKVTKQSSTKENLKMKKCSNGCSYYNKDAITRLSEEIIASVGDIEELVQKGEQLHACPYYAARGALNLGQLIVVPYNTLLHKATRDACKIDLKNNIVIIDEAHNLLDAIGNMYSSQVSGSQLCRCYNQLTQYKNKYENRFSAANLLFLNQLIYVIGQFIVAVGGRCCSSSAAETSRKGNDTKMYTLPEFVHSTHIDNYNIYRLLTFCQQSKISRKLQGFCETQTLTGIDNLQKTNSVSKESGIKAFLKQIATKDVKAEEAVVNGSPNANVTVDQSSTEMNNPILAVIGFLEALTNHTDDGRVVCSQNLTVGRGFLKFLLLNPAAHFKDIVKESRAVIVAGGTMQPITEFQKQLFENAGGDPSRIVNFSYGHVIPPENILPIALVKGPSNKQLDFSYQNRNSVATMNELGRILVNVCNVVPAGVVCFYPSYDYEDAVFQHFEKTGVVEKLNKKKRVFREPKKSGNIETVLNEYSAAIRRCRSNSSAGMTGALMFSVVGGKLSEGLNFNDDLGRCVIVVGMPYPNITSPELQEKMKFLDKTMGSGSGQLHYENLCMKAVNQSIGRAVRHKDDYAIVLLLDHRYSRNNVLSALPSWMSTSLQVAEKFGLAFGAISKFFSTRKGS